jgi:hypothetical protein
MRQFIVKVLSEPNGQPSFSRTAGAIALSFVCGCLLAILGFLGYLLHHYHVVSNSSDLIAIVNGFSTSLAEMFKSAAEFMLAVTSAYGVNKVSTLFGRNPLDKPDGQ